MAGQCKDMLFCDAKGKWVKAPRPAQGDVVVTRIGKPFKEIAGYYANIIDYFRCLLGLVACIMIQHMPEYKWAIAAAVMSNVLLDWVDGPVARKYGQSSVMGCGWDWRADLFAQYNIAIWCMLCAPGTLPTTLTVLFTLVEIATGVPPLPPILFNNL